MTTFIQGTEARETLIDRIQRAYTANMDEEISPFRAAQILDLMLETIGPAIYNQAVQDTRAHLQTKLDDLDGEVYFKSE